MCDETQPVHITLAKKILASPDAKPWQQRLARIVIENFLTKRRTGKEPNSFAEYMLRDPDKEDL
jgi:hypothetical protein